MGGAETVTWYPRIRQYRFSRASAWRLLVPPVITFRLWMSKSGPEFLKDIYGDDGLRLSVARTVSRFSE